MASRGKNNNGGGGGGRQPQNPQILPAVDPILIDVSGARPVVVRRLQQQAAPALQNVQHIPVSFFFLLIEKSKRK